MGSAKPPPRHPRSAGSRRPGRSNQRPPALPWSAPTDEFRLRLRRRQHRPAPCHGPHAADHGRSPPSRAQQRQALPPCSLCAQATRAQAHTTTARRHRRAITPDTNAPSSGYASPIHPFPLHICAQPTGRCTPPGAHHHLSYRRSIIPALLAHAPPAIAHLCPPRARDPLHIRATSSTRTTPQRLQIRARPTMLWYAAARMSPAAHPERNRSHPHIKAPDRCPHCNSTRIATRGTRKKKLETVPLFRCRSCGRTFTHGPRALRNKTLSEQPGPHLTNESTARFAPLADFLERVPTEGSSSGRGLARTVR